MRIKRLDDILAKEADELSVFTLALWCSLIICKTPSRPTNACATFMLAECLS